MFNLPKYMKHEFIGKSVFFPEQGILAIGDLHIGYEHSIQKSGVSIPDMQVGEVIGDLKKILEEIKSKNWKLKKVVFLGDIKHYFNYEWKERFNFNKVLDFLKDYVKDSAIVLIKGNHDKFDFAGKKMKNYYFNRGIMFFHGHMEFSQLREERVRVWVLGHLHPSVKLIDKANIKREKYKCFLTGKYKGMEAIVVPSFFGAVEGSAVNEKNYVPEEGFSVIPVKNLQKFKVHAIGDNGEIFDFGEVGRL